MGNTANHLSNEHFQSISICSHILTLQLYGLVFSQLNALPCVAFHPSHSPGRLKRRDKRRATEPRSIIPRIICLLVAFSSRLQRYFSKQTSNERATSLYLYHLDFSDGSHRLTHPHFLQTLNAFYINQTLHLLSSRLYRTNGFQHSQVDITFCGDVC